MKRIFEINLLISVLIFFHSCTPSHNQEGLDNYFRSQLNVWNKNLTSVIISDIFTPPVASRIYAYANVAAYEASVSNSESYVTLAGQLNGLSTVPAPDNPNIYYPLASIMAFSKVGRTLVFDKQALQAYEDDFLKQVKDIGISDDVYQASISYGNKVADHILSWASVDGYKDREALTRYNLIDDPGKWQPTPPDYMPAIEPHWNKIRTMALDSAQQYPPPPPTKFDTARTSLFFKEAYQVYDAVKGASDEQVEIAKFWDCNPNISYIQGHVMFYTQKISPGGHWISISSIATEKENLPFMDRSAIFTITSVCLFDAFISCWDEKYRSSLIRPETYINKYLDKEWRPLLQTPAFPEYTSGHSVISRAAAESLTYMIGDNFTFQDSTEVEFGLPARAYDSFYDASDEAAISRMYGGIHYLPACVNGVEQGKKVAEYILSTVHLKKEPLSSLSAND
ncbi:MAG: vanadium-dependent haloperoxidase [Bacteroidota bacterium]